MSTFQKRSQIKTITTSLTGASVSKNVPYKTVTFSYEYYITATYLNIRRWFNLSPVPNVHQLNIW